MIWDWESWSSFEPIINRETMMLAAFVGAFDAEGYLLIVSHAPSERQIRHIYERTIQDF
jgi:hypothetical protein